MISHSLSSCLIPGTPENLGYEAAKNHRKGTACPFKLGTEDYYHWWYGYDEGCYSFGEPDQDIRDTK